MWSNDYPPVAGGDGSTMIIQDQHGAKLIWHYPSIIMVGPSEAIWIKRKRGRKGTFAEVLHFLTRARRAALGHSCFYAIYLDAARVEWVQVFVYCTSCMSHAMSHVYDKCNMILSNHVLQQRENSLRCTFCFKRCFKRYCNQNALMVYSHTNVVFYYHALFCQIRYVLCAYSCFLRCANVYPVDVFSRF